MVSDMIESRRSTQIAFLIRNAFWVSWGAGARYKQYSCYGKSCEQVLWTSFLGNRPRVFPPPVDRFSAQTTENRNYLTNIPRARMGSKSIAHEADGRIGYWLRGHEGERNNCFSKIQLVGRKYRDKTTFS